ncbi:JAB domain-containing protein [Sphingomonas bacterium]|uniref:JAB domain-containing protein n=1 Tax=Sphingomonas bacterium TaxID=1895847 RepID=UPI00157631D2|nr:JAB domain-containing protein [Sphingomonas bacterium]
MAVATIDHALLDPLILPIARQPVEVCVMLYLGVQYRLAGLRHIRGARDGIELSTRLFVADALAFDAHSAIMAHNHPSGDPRASADDLSVTRRLARAFEAVGVTLIDHIVLASGGRTSLRAAGYL